MNLQPLIDAALAEDIASGDVTTLALVPAGMTARMSLAAREPLVMAGGAVAAQVFQTLDAGMRADIHVADGAPARAGEALMTLSGSARALLTGERVALNLIQRMCGVATLTRRYVDAVAGTRAVILDTRKTMPGLRALDKYAVTCGGGRNHRMGLYDAAMIKDNHIGIRDEGLGIGDVVERMRANLSSPVPIIVECDTLAQLDEALEAAPDRILLDNMPPAQLRAAVARVGGRIPLEASGGVSLETVRAIAETGVDFISVGRLTHSAPAADIGADITVSGSARS